MTARAFYERLRPLMPPVRRVRLAGVRTGTWRRLSDLVAPAAWTGGRRDEPGYEEGLVDGIATHVRPGDRVVVVGGGNGVTSVRAAQAAPGGPVTTFEASDHMLRAARRTLRLSPAGRRVTLRHAVVGAAHGVYGETTATVVPAADLPSCDVLILDCEGAERDILPALLFRPRAILVETHGLYESPTEVVRALLVGAGYVVVSDVVAESRVADYCHEHDIRVLAALTPEAA